MRSHFLITVAIVAALVSPTFAQLAVDPSVPPLYLATTVKTEVFAGFPGTEANRVGRATMDELLAELARNDQPGKLTTPWRLIPSSNGKQTGALGATITVSLATDRATIHEDESTDIGPTVIGTFLGRGQRRRTTYSSSSDQRARTEVRLFRFSLRATKLDGTLLLAWEVPILVADYGVDVSRARFRIGDYRHGHSRRGQSDAVRLLRDAEVPLQAAAELHQVLLRWWNDPTVGAAALGAVPSSAAPPPVGSSVGAGSGEELHFQVAPDWLAEARQARAIEIEWRDANGTHRERVTRFRLDEAQGKPVIYYTPSRPVPLGGITVYYR